MVSIEVARQFFADEIRTVANLQSTALVEALASVPRETFLGPGPWHVATPDPRRPGAMEYWQTPDAHPRHIYHNVLVAIDASRELNNGHPATLAACLDRLNLSRGETFVHVGCGVGYYTALGAAVVGEAGRVFAIDIDEGLAARAKQNLSVLPHVTVIAADGTSFVPDSCDAILVNAGFTHPLPLWLDALNNNGRVLLPITAAVPASPISAGGMLLVTRGAGGFSARPMAPIAILASPTGRDDRLNGVIRQAFGTGQWLRIRSVRRDRHDKTDACCIHAEGVCVSTEG